jgi:hypothetical protein
MSEKQMVESTFRDLTEKRKKLQDFVRDHAELFGQFGTLVDEFNQSRAMHVGALKVAKTSSPLFKMTIPKHFVCPDQKMAEDLLKERFKEFAEIELKVNTAAVRNAIKAETVPGIEMVFTEVDDTPRHSGPKEIDISALRGD